MTAKLHCTAGAAERQCLPSLSWELSWLGEQDISFVFLILQRKQKAIRIIRGKEPGIRGVWWSQFISLRPLVLPGGLCVVSLRWLRAWLCYHHGACTPEHVPRCSSPEGLGLWLLSNLRGFLWWVQRTTSRAVPITLSISGPSVGPCTTPTSRCVHTTAAHVPACLTCKRH